MTYTKEDMRPASEGVETVEHLRRRLANHMTAVEAGMNAIQEQWAALGRLGAQRDDHAANLLESHLRRPMKNLADFARICFEQIDGYCNQSN